MPKDSREDSAEEANKAEQCDDPSLSVFDDSNDDNSCSMLIDSPPEPDESDINMDFSQSHPEPAATETDTVIKRAIYFNYSEQSESPSLNQAYSNQDNYSSCNIEMNNVMRKIESLLNQQYDNLHERLEQITSEIKNGITDNDSEGEDDNDDLEEPESDSDLEEAECDAGQASTFASFMNETDFPLYTGSNLTYNQHLMILLAFSVRHNLNMEQLRDMLKVLKAHCPASNYCLENIDDINEIITNQLEIQVHDQCVKCGTIFPDDEDEYKCRIVTDSGHKCSG